MRRNNIFMQLMQLLSHKRFRRIVEKYSGDKYTKRMDCWQQLTILMYALIKDLQSLREVETSLLTRADRWDSIGLESVARSTLSDANKLRPHEMFEQLFQELLEKCTQIAPSHKFNIGMPVFTQDSTLISLCLSSFPWARYRKRKGALKLHMLLDHDGCLPSFVRMTDGKCHDVRVVKDPSFDFPALPPDSILTIDRGYIDYCWLYSLNTQNTTFIMLAKSNMAYKSVGQHKEPVRRRGILKDQLIQFTNFYEKEAYPQALRLIRFYDKKEKKVLKFITNNMELAASTIAALYKGRWQIETFFKWLKQNLKIKSFLGTSENAVRTQIWVALILYLLLSFIKFQTKYSFSMLELLRVIREVLLDSRSLIELLRVRFERFAESRAAPVQLSLAL